MKKSLNIIDATKELNIIRSQKGYKSPFKAVGTYRLIDDGLRPEATVIIETEKKHMHEASAGVGPVDASCIFIETIPHLYLPCHQGREACRFFVKDP